jgi:4-amino-4-deoxy-L-arabinose transferase-like glycosyltransferase
MVYFAKRRTFFSTAKIRMQLQNEILKNKLSYFFLAILCVFYFIFSCLFISKPGLEYDEVLFANAALGNVDGSFITHQWKFGGITIPVMLMPYIGAVKAYLYAPIFKLFAPTATAVRLPAIIIGVITLIITYLLVIRLFTPRTALIAVCCLATDPTYIYHMRLDRGPVVLMMLFKLASLYCLVRFFQSGKRGFLAAGAFCLGLGLFDKVNFAWYLIALVPAALVFWRRDWWRILILRNALTFVGCFLLGSWPLFVYNLVTKGNTFKGQMDPPTNFFKVLPAKINLLDLTLNGNALYYIINAGEPIGSFNQLSSMSGRNWFVASLLSLIDFRGTLLLPVLLGAGLVYGCLMFIKGSAGRRAASFFVILFLVIFAQIIYTFRATGSHHVMMLYPFHQIIIASGFGLLIFGGVESRRPALRIGRRILRYLSGLILVLLVLSNIVVCLKYLDSISRFGGKGVWSDAIYDLHAYTAQHKDQNYVLMDWGFNTQMLLLARGDIKKQEIFWQLNDPDREQASIEYLRQKALANGTVFVFHAPQRTVFYQPTKVFDEMLAKYDLATSTSTVFNQRDGEPVYILQTVARRESRDPSDKTEPASPVVRKEGNYIIATPNPVPAGPEVGTTNIIWRTKNIQPLEVHVYVVGIDGNEHLFATGSEASQRAPWITSDQQYEFRLYSGSGADRKLLDKVVVTRDK